MEQQSQDGHLCSAQQQPPGEVPAAGRWDAAGHTWHVSGRGGYVQSETLAEQGLLPGMDCVTATLPVCSSVCAYLPFDVGHIWFLKCYSTSQMCPNILFMMCI